MSTIAELKVVRIDTIDVSKTNPRKNFDTQALKELSESILEHGILQPILVRFMGAEVEKGGVQPVYELVCGERRYRAAILAGLEEIPCNIRELSDEEAFEMQIVENLERKDVHPLDEADAFKRMLDSGKYTMADIAAKMAKTETFIAQRLKLVDLIEEIRKEFMDGNIGIGHAILLARCPIEQQQKLHKEARGDYGTVVDLKDEIESDSQDLTEAKFDITDANLVPGCGACTLCPKRSGANPVLFADMEDDMCFDEKCYESKEAAFVLQELGKIIAEGKNIPILNGWGKPDKLIEDLCKQFDITILKQYETYWTYERSGYKKVKGFNVSNGDYQEVYVDTKSKEVQKAVEGASSEELEIKTEIAKIKERADRALELDQEKIWLRINEIPVYDKDIPSTPLYGGELKAAMAIIYESTDWTGRELMLKEMGITGKTYDKTTNEQFLKLEFTPEQVNKALRSLIIQKLPQNAGTSTSSFRNIGLYTLKCQFKSKEVSNVIDEQIEIANKRIGRSNAKIKELQDKLAKIPTPPAPEENKAKAKKTAMDKSIVDAHKQVTKTKKA